MRMLLNPVVARMVILLIVALASFAIGAFAIHRFRKGLGEEVDSLSQSPLAAEGLPIHSYHAVIQQLKQQKHELTAQQLSDRRKARAADAVSAAVFTNLSCGVLFFNTAGLLRQANHAARQLLGFASPIGMGLADLFRTASLRDSESATDQPSLLDAVAPALTGEQAIRGLMIDFVCPDGIQRTLELTVAPVLGEDTRPMGTAFVLTDKTEMARMGTEEESSREVAAEMALALRTSLTTICGYAQQMTKSRDPELAHQLAADISTEAAQLDHMLGSFLTGAGAKAAGTGS